MKKFFWLLMIMSPLGAKKLIVTSVSPLRLIINEMVDTSQFEVINIVPPGQNPHTFDPRPGDIKKIEQACAFIYIADIAEAWAHNIISNIPVTKRPKVIKIWSLLGKKESINMNPHFWFDPHNVRKIAVPLGDSIVKCGKVKVDSFISRIDSLDAWIRMNVSSLKRRCFIPSHNSWTVFARAYGIKTTDVLWTSEGTELSPRKILKIIKQAKKCNTNVLVLDSIYNPSLVTPFRENGFKIVTLDPQGWDETFYTEFMRRNLSKLFEALNE